MGKHAREFRRMVVEDPSIRLAAVFEGTSGDDRLIGTAKADTFHAYEGGSDRLTGNAGNDTFHLGGAFDPIDGGDGRDILRLNGDYSAGLLIDRTMLTGVERIIYGSFPASPRHDYALTFTEDLHDGATVQTLTIGSGDHWYELANEVTIDASAMTRTRLDIESSIKDDVIRGGQLADRLAGDSGADVIYGGGGRDIFEFRGYDAEARRSFDTIMDFARGDRIELMGYGTDFRLGAADGEAGTIDIRYARRSDTTILTISTDETPRPELIIHLAGNHDLTIDDFIF